MRKDGKRWIATGLLVGALTLLSACGEPDQTPSLVDPTEKGESCEPNVQQELARLNVAESDVEKIVFQQRIARVNRGGKRIRQVIGFDAWVRPIGVKGHLVVEMYVNCRVQRSYTTGEYNLPGLPNH
jgi:hypothetical protein